MAAFRDAPADPLTGTRPGAAKGRNPHEIAADPQRPAGFSPDTAAIEVRVGAGRAKITPALSQIPCLESAGRRDNPA